MVERSATNDLSTLVWRSDCCFGVSALLWCCLNTEKTISVWGRWASLRHLDLRWVDNGRRRACLTKCSNALRSRIDTDARSRPLCAPVSKHVTCSARPRFDFWRLEERGLDRLKRTKTNRKQQQQTRHKHNHKTNNKHITTNHNKQHKHNHNNKQQTTNDNRQTQTPNKNNTNNTT